MRAGYWSFGLFGMEKLLGLARVIVLAAFLGPRDFGLFGFAILALMAADSLTRTGFREALIRHPEDIARHLDVAWTVQVLRGLLLAALLFFFAPLIAAFFDEPGSASLTRAISLILVLQAFANIGVVYFHRDLDFRREFAYRLTGTLADLAAAVVGAYLLRSAWALLLGLVASELGQLIASYLLHPYRPRFRWDRSVARELASYGIWVSLEGIMVFAGTRAAGLVVGKIAGAATLGIFQMAERIPQIAIREVGAAAQRIALPAYALVQRDLPRLRRSYLAIGGLSVALAAPAAVGIALLGPPFVRFFLKEAWAPMIPPLILLACAGWIRALSATGIPLFQACGVPRWSFFMQAARALALIALIAPLTRRWGVEGAAFGMIAVALAGAIVWLIGMRKILPWTIGDARDALLAPLLSSAVMGGMLYLLRSWTLSWTHGSMVIRVAWMGMMGILGVAMYALAFFAFSRRMLRSAFGDTVQELLRNRGAMPARRTAAVPGRGGER